MLEYQLLPMWKTWQEFLALASIWPTPAFFCDHLGNKLVVEGYFSSFFLLDFKQILSFALFLFVCLFILKEKHYLSNKGMMSLEGILSKK